MEQGSKEQKEMCVSSQIEGVLMEKNALKGSKAEICECLTAWKYKQ